MTCVACEGFPSKENDPCGLCGKAAHKFRGGLVDALQAMVNSAADKHCGLKIADDALSSESDNQWLRQKQAEAEIKVLQELRDMSENWSETADNLYDMIELRNPSPL